MPQPSAQPPTPTNAERIATCVAQLARLTELGMHLAESVARYAERTLAEPEPDPEPVAPSDPAAEAPLPTQLPSPAPRNPVKLFDQLARTVSACIRLQTRILTAQNNESRPQSDPRRPLLRRALRPFIGTVPDEYGFPPGPSLKEIDTAVDDELQADPDRLTPILEILTLVCEELGLNPAAIPLPTAETPPPYPEPPSHPPNTHQSNVAIRPQNG